MRPVIIPATPPNHSYDEALELLVTVTVAGQAATAGGLKKQAVGYDKTDLIGKLIPLINDWIGRGAPLRDGTPVFLSMDDQFWYTAYTKALGLGTGDWGDARKGLIESIGQYCSYCESPIYSTLHIEHVLPKSTFPSHALSWPNFVLSCSTCNSAKGNSPNQGTIAPGLVPAPSTAASENYILNNPTAHFLWPKFDWTQFAANARFPLVAKLHWFEFYRQNPKVGAEIPSIDQEPLQRSFEAGTIGIDRGLFYVPYGAGNRSKQYFGAFVSPAPSYAGGTPREQELHQASTEIIEVASLNKILPAANSADSVDRRIYNRTLAWFRATQMRQILAAAVTADGPNPPASHIAPAIVDQIGQIAAKTGFWLVWISIFGDVALPGKAMNFQAFLRNQFTGTSPHVWTV